MTSQAETSLSFEQAYGRLESILNELNSGELSLEKSLKLYEEASKLIAHCNKRLSSAEQKIQTLIKTREGQVAMNSGNEPELEDFSRG